MSPLLWVTAFALAAGCGLVLTPPTLLLARKLRFLDHPSPRKVHVEPTPLLGGLPVLVAFGAATAWGIQRGWVLADGRLLGFLAGGGLVFTVGLVDDRVGLTPSWKLAGQTAAALVLVLSGNTSGVVREDALGGVLTLLWVVGITNAVNFLDNMDGISAGISGIAAFAFAVIAGLFGQDQTAYLALALAGASVAFLRFNWSPARIFLGDAGSLFLGYSLASLALFSTREREAASYLLVPLVVLAFPIFDLCFVVLCRTLEGRSWATPGQDHTSHRLRALLSGSRETALVIYLVSLACAALGVVVSLTGSPALAWSAVGAVAALLSGLGIKLSRVAAR